MIANIYKQNYGFFDFAAKGHGCFLKGLFL